MRNKNLMTNKPWSKEESDAFDLHIAYQDVRIRTIKERYGFL